MQKRGVTLIEIIIALFVFAVGILAVVRVITTNIAIIDTMKIKIQAQSLAKEGIDLVFNIRDTNLERGADRHCAFLNPEAITSIQNKVPFNGQVCGDTFGDGKKFRIALDPEGRIFVASTTTGAEFADTFALNQLQQFTGTNEYTGTMYIHTTEGTGLYFARYISFSAVTQSGVALDTNKLLKVTSHVMYQKGSIKGEATLESFIGAIKK